MPIVEVTDIVYIQCPKCWDLVNIEELQQLEENTEFNEDSEVTCPYCNESAAWDSGMGWNGGRSKWRQEAI